MLKLDRKTFFKEVRNAPFPGKLTQSQVDGMSDLLDAWEAAGTEDERHLAYTLATDFHETGGKMQPVREGFKSTDKAARYVVRNRKYGKPAGPHGHVYYGRGDVQLTWYDNYVRMGRILDLPLAEKPDIALQSKVSKRILVEGMLHGQSNRGDFTGKSLEDYFNDVTDDPFNARRIINGMDKAQLIAGYHHAFLEAVDAAVDARDQGVLFADDDDEAPSRLPRRTDQTSWGGVAAVIGGLGSSLGALTEKINTPLALAAVALVVVGAILVARGRLKLVRETGE